jgi:NAD(P)H-nitrite reductase large subunit
MEGRDTLACRRPVPAMTRCECSELSFDEIVRRVREGRSSLDGVQAETGAGLLCTACLPDLRDRLATEGVTEPRPGAVALGGGVLDSLVDPD